MKLTGVAIRIAWYTSLSTLVFIVAPVIRSAIGKSINRLYFAYWYQIGVMSEKAANTGLHIQQEIHACVPSCVFNSTELRFPLLKCCYCCLKGLLAIVIALSRLKTS